MPNASGVHWQSVHKLMTKLGYKKNDSDATMVYNEATDVTVFIYVDDGCLVGEARALFQVIKAIEERFELGQKGGMQETLGARIRTFTNSDDIESKSNDSEAKT